jgi:hypothetical protein
MSTLGVPLGQVPGPKCPAGPPLYQLASCYWYLYKFQGTAYLGLGGKCYGRGGEISATPVLEELHTKILQTDLNWGEKYEFQMS